MDNLYIYCNKSDTVHDQILIRLPKTIKNRSFTSKANTIFSAEQWIQPLIAISKGRFPALQLSEDVLVTPGYWHKHVILCIFCTLWTSDSLPNCWFFNIFHSYVKLPEGQYCCQLLIPVVLRHLSFRIWPPLIHRNILFTIWNPAVLVESPWFLHTSLLMLDKFQFSCDNIAFSWRLSWRLALLVEQF